MTPQTDLIKSIEELESAVDNRRAEETQSAPMATFRKRSFGKGLLGLALALLAGAALYLFVPPAPQIKVAIQFTGYTNIATTYTTREGTFFGAIATFRISNLGSRSLYQWPVSSYDTRNASGECGIDYGDPEFQGVLAPGQSKTVSVVAPWTVHGAWRAGFRFSKVDWRFKVANWPPWVQVMLRSVISERRLAMHSDHQAFSDWVDIPRVAIHAGTYNFPEGPNRPGPATNSAALLPWDRLNFTPTRPPKSAHEAP